MALKFDFSLYHGSTMEDLPVVTNPKITANEDELIKPEDGLFSESIFGPTQDFKCKCGHLTTSASKGNRCPLCNVLCDSKSLRNETFAKINLPFNMFIIQPFLIKNLTLIFGKESIKNILNVRQYEINKKNPYMFSLNLKKLVKISKLKEKDTVIEILVFDITSLHKIWRFLCKNETLYNTFIKPYSPNDTINKITFINHIPVTPPDSRPIIQIGKGKWNVSEVSKIYSKILKNIGNSQTISDDLYGSNEYLWGSSLYKYQYFLNQIHQLKHEKTFDGKKSIIRDSLSGKTVEFSSRQVIVPNPTVKPYGLALHEKVVKDFYVFNIINFIDEKYNKENKDSNIMSYVQSIERDIKLGNSIKFKDKDFFEFLQNGRLQNERVIMERPPVLYKLNTSGFIIDQVILESNLHRELNIIQQKNGYITINELKEPMNLLMKKMTGEIDSKDFNHNIIIPLNNKPDFKDRIIAEFNN